MNVIFFEKDDRFIFGLPLGFRDAGHKIIVSGSINEEKVYRLIKTFKPDLAVLLGWTTEHSDYNLKLVNVACTKYKVPLIYWATEDPTFTSDFTIPLIKKANPKYVFTVAPSRIPIYNSIGIGASYLPFAYQPSIHKPVKCQKWCKKNIAVVANAYPNVLSNDKKHYRHKSLNILVKPLLKNNISIDFWGKYWDQMEPFLEVKIPDDLLHGYLHYLQTNNVYRCSNIIIGLQNYYDELVSMRTYEILGSNGFLITSYNTKLCELFTPNKDLIVSTCSEETLEFVDFYLKHPEFRNKIKENATKAIKDHTYKHRAEKIINVLKKEKII
ncbi:MAG: glycosyltransferase [Vallitalea sp.]|jgi:spore maturation protein CgeB|nr:glycosyltransferase [Vallitalea sp.]